MTRQRWESYEDAAEYILNQMASRFDLERVEGKQKVPGLWSGTEYAIEGKGVLEGREEFIIIECRRYTKSRLKQEHIAALAYRIKDTGAKGGIVVTPYPLQKGAAKIAKAENIKIVQLTQDSTRKNYLLKFLDELFLGITDEVGMSDKPAVEIQNADSGEGI